MINRREVISALVNFEARRPVAWTYVDVPRGSIFGQMLGLLTSQAKTDVEVIAVDDPYVEVVSYADLRPAIVLTGIGHLRRLYAFRDLLELDLPEESVAIELSKQVILDSLADCFLLRGNEELAVRSYVLSILGGSAFFSPNPLDNLFAEQISLKELVFQYYGLAHEFGHCAKVRLSVDRSWIDREMESLPSRQVELARQHPDYDEARARELVERMIDYYRSSVNREDIVEEISADLFAVACLVNMGIIGWLDNYANLVLFSEDFIRSLYMCMNGVSISERLQQFARLVTQSAEPAHLGGHEWFAYQFMQEASQLRITMVLDFLAEFIAAQPVNAEFGSITAREWYRLLFNAVEPHRSRINSLDEGLTEARRILFGVKEGTIDLITRMRHYHEIDERMSWMTEFFVERVRDRIPSSGRYVDLLAATLRQ